MPVSEIAVCRKHYKTKCSLFSSVRHFWQFMLRYIVVQLNILRTNEFRVNCAENDWNKTQMY